VTGLEVLLAIAGFAVTILVIAGMILITPRGEVDVYADPPDAMGSNLSQAQAPERMERAPANL
jgi:hypothetical protein